MPSRVMLQMTVTELENRLTGGASLTSSPDLVSVWVDGHAGPAGVFGAGGQSLRVGDSEDFLANRQQSGVLILSRSGIARFACPVREEHARDQDVWMLRSYDPFERRQQGGDLIAGCSRVSRISCP